MNTIIQPKETEHSTRLSVDTILRIVSREFNQPIEKILSKSTRTKTTTPRQIAQAFALMIPGSTLDNTGKEIGGRDHATVSYSCKTVAGLYDFSRNYRAHVENIRDRLKISPEEFEKHLDRFRK